MHANEPKVLADIYADAELEVSPDIFQSRAGALTQIVKDADCQTLVELSKLIFGLESAELTDQIVALVRTEDASFSKKGNAREIQAISLAALEQMTAGDTGWSEGCHAILAIEGCGQRSAGIDDHIAVRMEGRRRAVAVEHGRFARPTKPRIAQIDTSDLEESLSELASTFPQGGANAENALQKLVTGLKGPITKSHTSLIAAVNSRLSAVYDELEQRRNETDVLWWVISGWSHLVGKPLTELSSEAKALLIGLDLGDLSDLRGGPAAVTTFIARALSGAQKGKKTVSLKEIIGALELDDIERLGLPETVDLDVTVFPVTGILQRRLNRKADPSEASLFEGIEKLDVSKKHPVADWANHVFHERALARSLTESLADRD